MGNTPMAPVAAPAAALEEALFRALCRWQHEHPEGRRYKPFPWPPEVDFTARDVQPAAQLYIPQNAYLVVSVLTDATVHSATVVAYQLLPSGRHSTSQMNLVNSPGSALTTYSQQLAEGFLLGVMATPSVTLARGQYFIEASIQLDAPTGGPVILPLFADYMTRPTTPVGWPGGGLQPATAGPGQAVSKAVTNPAAGADWSSAVVSQQRWQIASFSAQLVTSATVANRQVDIVIDDGSNVVWRGGYATAQTASTTVVYGGGTGLQSYSSASGNQNLGVPDALFAGPGWHIKSVTTNLQAGDQWSLIMLGIVQWLSQ